MGCTQSSFAVQMALPVTPLSSPNHTNTKENKMAKSTKSTARNYNYLEVWNTRFGPSTRIVTRKDGKFVTNVSFTGLLKSADKRS